MKHAIVNDCECTHLQDKLKFCVLNWVCMCMNVDNGCSQMEHVLFLKSVLIDSTHDSAFKMMTRKTPYLHGPQWANRRNSLIVCKIQSSFPPKASFGKDCPCMLGTLICLSLYFWIEATVLLEYTALDSSKKDMSLNKRYRVLLTS